MIPVRFVASLLIFVGLLSSTLAQTPAETEPPLRWWKGNTHAHTYWSDGGDFPEMVADRYKQRGYHFLSLSDHNRLGEGTQWMRMSALERRGGKIAIEKLTARFGTDWLETRTAENGAREVRLKPLNEFRSFIEENDRFILLQGEEISDAGVHLNAINIVEVIPPQGGPTPELVIANNVRAVEEQSKRAGQPMLVHVNHPNFRWQLTSEELAAPTSGRFFEVFNGNPSVNQRGDELHPSIDRMWDIVNTLRLKNGAEPMYGVGTDDSHTYHFSGMPRSVPFRGWSVVRARRLTPGSILAAMNAGDFYASSGVILRDMQFDPRARELTIEIEPEGDATFTTQFVGTPRNVDTRSRPAPTTQRTSRIYSDEIGKTFTTDTGLRATYRMTGDELYVRAIITSSKPAEFPSWEGQPKEAWTQPVGWK